MTVISNTVNERYEMAQAVLVASSKVILRQTLRRLSIAELNYEAKKRKRSIFYDIILKKLGDSIRAPEKPIKDHVPYSDDVEPDSVSLPDDNDPINKDRTSFFLKPITDQWINAKLNLPQGEKFHNTKSSAKVRMEMVNRLESMI